MKTITLEYQVCKKKEIVVKDLPKRWQRFLAAWQTDEDDRTDEQWDIVDEGSFAEMLEEVFNEDAYDVEVYDCE